MITDKDRVDFLQVCAAEGDPPDIMPWGDVREQIDRQMAEDGDYLFPEHYCTCGTGFDDWDFDDWDFDSLECIRSTPIHYGYDGYESWTSFYKCPECGAEIAIEESN